MYDKKQNDLFLNFWQESIGNKSRKRSKENGAGEMIEPGRLVDGTVTKHQEPKHRFFPKQMITNSDSREIFYPVAFMLTTG